MLKELSDVWASQRLPIVTPQITWGRIPKESQCRLWEGPYDAYQQRHPVLGHENTTAATGPKTLLSEPV